MEYRRLGSAGVKLSVLSIGSWVTYGNQVDVEAAAETLKAAYDRGVNFFDNAESYAGGRSEEIMGAALKRLGLRRSSYLVSSKYFFGIHDGPNEKATLNRKYLLQAVDGSLARLGLDYLDLAYCHRPDRETPVEEVVYAMSDIVASGRAVYWGTSEWSAEEIREAWEIADRRNLRKPVVEQPLYNLVFRERVEEEYARLYEGLGLGLTTFSPLLSGVLSGKYAKGVPEGARLGMKEMQWLAERYPEALRRGVAPLAEIAAELGATQAQLAIAWCAKNPRVSSVITGASSTAQVAENLAAVELLPKLTKEILARIEALMEPLRGLAKR